VQEITDMQRSLKMTRLREYQAMAKELSHHCMTLEQSLSNQNNFICMMKNDWAEVDTFLRTGNASAA